MRGDDGRGPRPTRRQVIAGAGASALALTAGAGFAERPSVASGHVFHDRGGTGRRRAGDPGIPGVMVSNGRDVVLTDSEGRWRLPVADGDSVFVIKPPHWATPAGPGGVPRFLPFASPAGQPERHRLPPRRRCPDRHAAGHHRLSAQAPGGERSRFEVACWPTRSPRTARSSPTCATTSSPASPACGAAFGINHGDVVFDDLSLYPRYLQILGASGIPWHHCPGNHDINSEARDDRTSRETWKRVFGPRHYAFQHAGATFILLDNVHYFGHNPGTPDSGRYCGRIGEQQLQFVRNVLAHVPPEQLVVLSMHIPLATIRTRQRRRQHRRSPRPSGAALFPPAHGQLLRHMHLTEHHYLGAADGFRGAKPHHHHVLTAASGGWWGGPKDSRGIPSADSQDGTPNGFHVLAVEGSACTTSFVPAAGKSRAQLRAVVDGPHRRDAQAKPHGHGAGATAYAHLSQCELIVNVFDGGPADARDVRDVSRRRRAHCDAARSRPATPLSLGYFRSMRRCRSRGCGRCLRHTYGKRRSPRGCGPARIALRSRQQTNTAADIARTCCSRLRAGLNPRHDRPLAGRRRPHLGPPLAGVIGVVAGQVG